MKKIGLPIIIYTILLTACEFAVPIKEMVQSKQLIQRAVEVKANKYAPKELNEAKKHLLSSHDKIDKKKDKAAKEEALKSIAASNKAIEKSLPLLANDELKKTKTMYDEIIKLNAIKFSNEDYIKAGELLKKSKEQIGTKEYWKSYLTSQKAALNITIARNNCMAKIPSLENDIKNLETKANELKTKKGADQFKQQLGALDTEFAGVKKTIEDKNLVDAVQKIEAIKKMLVDMETKLALANAKETIKRIKKEADNLKAKRGEQFASNDLNTVYSALNEASGKIEQNNFQDASKKIQDAEYALKAAKSKTEKGIALERIKKAENLLIEVQKKDVTGKHKTKFSEADTLIQEAYKDVKNEQFAEAIVKADKTETMLNSLQFEENKKTIETNTTETSGGTTKYKVIYNKRKPDCLWRIAHKVYKNAKLWPLIYSANKDKIKDPDLIFPGQVFIIPKRGSKIDANSVKDSKKSDSNNDTTTKTTTDNNNETKTKKDSSAINDSTDKTNNTDDSKKKNKNNTTDSSDSDDSSTSKDDLDI